jgi:hypothetical protein
MRFFSQNALKKLMDIALSIFDLQRSRQGRAQDSE